MFTNVQKNLFYYDQFLLLNHYFMKFFFFHKSNIWHILSGCVLSLHGCEWPFCLGLLNCVNHWLFQLLFFLPIRNIICFLWLSILEHTFFNYVTSCGNINIHHIHICNECLCFNNWLILCYYQNFPMKHFLHLSNLWTICHFRSIQTRDVACIWRCLLWFLAWLCCFYDCHRVLSFFFLACFHIMVHHPTIYAMFVRLSYIIMCFY